MRLAGFTDYSLRVLIYLALKDNERSTVSEIADKYQISKNHLVKVVHNLSSMGVINSFKGKGGGICLARPLKEINIGKLVKELEMESPLVECLGLDGECRINSSCKLKGALKLAEKNFFDTLESYTLADIITNKSTLVSSLEL